MLHLVINCSNDIIRKSKRTILWSQDISYQMLLFSLFLLDIHVMVTIELNEAAGR